NPLSKKPISTVDFYVDGQFYNSDYTAPYSIPWDGTYEADKAYVVQAWATDTNNRVGKSAPVTFTLKKPVPTIQITSVVPSGANPNILDVHMKATAGAPGTTVDFVNLNYDNGEYAGSAQNPANLNDIVVQWDTRYVPSGLHTLVATVTNSTYRVGTSLPVDYTVDHPSPTVSITAPLANSTQYGNFTITTDPHMGPGSAATLTYVEVIADSTTWLGSTDGTGGWQVPVQAYQLEPGMHVFTARVTDSDGFVGTSTPVSFTFARAVPSVTITSPAAGTEHFGTVTVGLDPVASTHGNMAPINYVQVVVDDFAATGSSSGVLDPDTGLIDWTVEVQLGSLPAGTHTLVATAYDLDGYSGSSLPRSITTFVPQPRISVQTPTSGTTVYGTLTIANNPQPSIKGGSAITSVEAYAEDTWIGNSGGPDWTINADPSQLTNGVHALRVKVNDAQGYSTMSAPISITVEHPVPTVTITSPAPPVPASGFLPVTINAIPHGHAPPGTSISGYDVIADGTTVLGATNAPDSTVPAKLSLLSPGVHSLVARARDDSPGQYVGSSAPLQVTTADRPPTVTVTGPSNNSTISAPTNITAVPVSNSSGSAIDGVEFSVDGVILGTVTNDGSGTYALLLDPGAYDNGLHTLSAIAFDVAGYRSASHSVSVTFNTPGPSATISSPSPGSTPLVSDDVPFVVSGQATPSGPTASITYLALYMDGNYQDARTASAGELDNVPVDFSLPSFPGGPHILSLTVMDSAGKTRHSANVSFTARKLPQAPYAYASGGDSKITVAWARPDSGGMPITSYNIQVSDATSYPPTPMPTIAVTPALLGMTAGAFDAAANLSYDVAAPASVYREFTVTAVTATGESAPSSPSQAAAYDATPPPAVTGLTVVGNGAAATASWTVSTAGDVARQDFSVDPGATPLLYSPQPLEPSVHSQPVTGAVVGSDYTVTVTPTDTGYNQGPASSVTVRATALALSRNISTITYGGFAVLSAKLTKVTGGATLPNVPITFQWRKKGTATWSTVAAVPKTGTVAPYIGIARLTVKPTYNVEYQAIYKGGTNLFGRTSAVTSVLVKPKILSRITNTSGTTITSVRYGSYVYFKATVNPKHVGQYVIIQRYTSAGWRTLASVKLNSLSAIAYRYKPPKGTFSYRIYKAADSDHAATYGATMKLKIS
ncbi:MAG: large repetitive protein, partial [Frankiaceae bacterium]|nr:large repetitive protein [Frankiaceae bacterium]